MFKKLLINKAYKKRFKKLNQTFFTDHKTGLIAFEEYLKYLRDQLILKKNSCTPQIQNSISTLIAAIAEFDSYNKQFDEQKKDFHWVNFCELIKLNMKEWIDSYDSI